MSLTDKKCVPCEGGTPPLTGDQIKDFLPQVSSNWHVVSNKSIKRDFTLQNFQAALDLVNQIGELAEKEGHHPDLHLTDYKKLGVELSTHAIGGLSENDFILAAKIDALKKT